MLDTGTATGGGVRMATGAPPLVPPILAPRLQRATGRGEPSTPSRPGGRTAVLVEQSAARLADVTDASLVDLATMTQQLVAWAGAVQLQVIRELYLRRSVPSPQVAARGGGRALQDLVEGLARRSTLAEVALATGGTEYSTGQKLSAANALDERLPATRAAYQAGNVEWPKVQAIVDATTGLPGPAAAAVEAEAVARLVDTDPATGRDRPAPGVTLPRLREALAESVARHDPDAPEAGERARRQRRVVFTPVKDGMTELWALLPGTDAAQAQARIRDLADAARTPDDDRTADQRRADTLVDLLTGRSQAPATADAATDPTHDQGDRPTQPDQPAPHDQPDQPAPHDQPDQPAPHDQPDQPDSGRRPDPGPGSPVRPQVLVVIGWETFLGLNDDPGHLSGHGPVPAAMIRDLAAQGTWRCAVVDDRHGTLLGLGRATWTPGYRPGDALTRHLTVRDRTCTFPGCRQPAHRCDLDHRDPHPGGATCECNLAALCRTHHRLKHEAGFTVRREAGTDPPAVVWATPAGRTYRVEQNPLFRPAPAPPF